jgi:hypothetical protein
MGKGVDWMTPEIRKARKALQALHRCYLAYAMQTHDMDYVTKMNAVFKLLERLEEENA